jgi:hypothetical protein
MYMRGNTFSVNNFLLWSKGKGIEEVYQTGRLVDRTVGSAVPWDCMIVTGQATSWLFLGNDANSHDWSYSTFFFLKLATFHYSWLFLVRSKPIHIRRQLILSKFLQILLCQPVPLLMHPGLKLTKTLSESNHSKPLPTIERGCLMWALYIYAITLIMLTHVNNPSM